MSDHRDQLSYCPICGEKWRTNGEGHRCSQKTLSAIDGANTRAWEPAVLSDPTNRSKEEKLKDGLELIHGHDQPA